MKTKILFMLTLLVLGLVGCGSNASSSSTSGNGLDAIPAEYAGKTNPLGADAAVAGAKVFKDYCVACHGEKGLGNGPASASLVPAPKNLVELQSQVGDDYLFWRINTGRDGTAMVAWQNVLTEEQIWQVISFIHTLK